MKLFLDENLPLSFLEPLQKLGFSVEHVRTVGLQGADDTQIAAYAGNQQAILITKDLEFGSIFLYPAGSHYGLIVLRLPSLFKKEQLLQALLYFLKNINQRQLIQHVNVVEAGRYRARELPSKNGR